MGYKFTAYGHENITAKHKTTLEFTKDKDLSLKGDCIVGVNADFSLQSIKKFINKLKTNTRKNSKNFLCPKNSEGIFMKIKIIILLKNKKIIKEEINAEINPDFNSDREMVIRKSDFKDERTFAVRGDKGASQIDKRVINKLKIKENKIIIFIKDMNQ